MPSRFQTGTIRQQESFLALPPFLRLLLPCVWVYLVPHSSQDVGGGFSGHDERLYDSRRQLAEDATHRPRHPALFMLPGGRVIDSQCCVCDALWTEAKSSIGCCININGIWVKTLFICSFIVYLFYNSVGFGYTFSQVNRLMSQSVMGEPFHPLCVPLIGHRGHHVVGRLSCCLNWHTSIRLVGRLVSASVLSESTTTGLPGWSAPSGWWAPGRPWR